MSPRERRKQVEQLFRQYGRGVGSYCLARVGNVDVAETITSNVFLVVVRRIEQCRTSPVAWLWSIVRSELARYFRQKRPTDTLEESFPDPALTPPEVAARNEMQASIRDALGRLNYEQQRIIYLKYFMDIPNTAIATELGLSVSNVGVIVHRAVKQLRDMMEESSGGRRGTRQSEDGARAPTPERDEVSRHSVDDAGIPKRLWLLLVLAPSLVGAPLQSDPRSRVQDVPRRGTHASPSFVGSTVQNAPFVGRPLPAMSPLASVGGQCPPCTWNYFGSSIS